MRLENQLKGELKKQSDDGNSKEKKIEELEKDIETFVQTYAEENEQLKVQLSIL